eukprot:scaffold100856_cov22-Tisochrysis_lutea.AAC.2
MPLCITVYLSDWLFMNQSPFVPAALSAEPPDRNIHGLHHCPSVRLASMNPVPFVPAALSAEPPGLRATVAEAASCLSAAFQADTLSPQQVRDCASMLADGPF